MDPDQIWDYTVCHRGSKTFGQTAKHTTFVVIGALGEDKLFENKMGSGRKQNTTLKRTTKLKAGAFPMQALIKSGNMPQTGSKSNEKLESYRSLYSR